MAREGLRENQRIYSNIYVGIYLYNVQVNSCIELLP